MSPSSATVMVPADWPYSKTEANTNVSETEMVAGIDGSLTVSEPLASVRITSQYHWGSIGVSNSL